MDYQEQILEFLKQPENLRIALDVAKYVEVLRPNLHKAFWLEMQQALENRLKQSSFEDKWTISSEGSFNESWKNLHFQIKSLPESCKDKYLMVSLMQEAQPGYQLRYGLCWLLKAQPVPVSEAFRIMLEKSIAAGVSEIRQEPFWPIYSNLDISLRSDEFMQQFCETHTEFIVDLSEKIWAYFTMLEPYLYQLNQELFNGTA